jgi:hypothetical protein
LDGPAAPARSEQPRCQRARNGGPPPAWRQRGQPPGVGGAASAAPPRERGRARPAPRARTVPRSFPAEALAPVAIPPRLTPPLLGTSRVLLTISARAEARRWRAAGAPLKPLVEKVVIPEGAGRCQGGFGLRFRGRCGFAGHGGMASRLLFPDRRWFRASRACVSRTGPLARPPLGGAAGVLDAPDGEPTIAGQGKARQTSRRGLWRYGRPIRRLCGVAGPLAAVIPSGVPRPGRPGGMGRSASGPGGANHKLVRAAGPALWGAGGGGGQTTSRPRARPGRQLMLPGGQRGGGARRAWRRRPG